MKLGSDEFETVKSLMSMTLFAIVSDCLDVDIAEIKPSDRLLRDLGMTYSKEQEMRTVIADIYDGFEVDFSTISTVQSLLDQLLTEQLSSTGRVLH
jgi:hypothetical protein